MACEACSAICRTLNGNAALLSSQIARAVDADRAGGAAAFDAAEHRCGHVAPAGDEGGETAGGAADHKEVDVVGAGHDRDARFQLALVPARQVAVVDPAVAV